jgi:hypothetical protein
MAWTSGTASDYLDLLTRLKAFVTEQMLPANERWQVMRWVPGPPAELVLKGVGLAGTDEIYVAIQTETSSDYGNWKLRGYVTYNPGVAFDAQYNSSQTFYALLTLSAMPYWFVANGRRIVVVVKTGTYYECVHLGLFLPYATPAQYPYPLAGRWLIQRLDALEQRLHLSQPSARTSGYSGRTTRRRAHGTGCPMWPSSWGSNTARMPGWSYPLLPFILQGLGEWTVCYSVPGYGNAVENIISAGGVDHLVVQDVYRTGYSDYWALEARVR